jgi:hypothetical protein
MQQNRLSKLGKLTLISQSAFMGKVGWPAVCNTAWGMALAQISHCPSLTSATAELVASNRRSRNSTPVRRVENSFASQAAAATRDFGCSRATRKSRRTFPGEVCLGSAFVPLWSLCRTQPDEGTAREGMGVYQSAIQFRDVSVG